MQLPSPFRALVGLIAVTAEEAQRLPDRVIELPMLAVSTALQASLRAQQRYARLTARGDEVLNHRSPTDEPPAWATFDDPVPADQRDGVAGAEADPSLGAPAGSQLLDELLGESENASAAADAAQAKARPKDTPPAKKSNERKAISRPRSAPPSRFDDAPDE